MRKAPGLIKKAPLVGAFFIAAGWLGPLAAEPCGLPAGAQAVKVRHVHDGDTLVLSDNRKVRLIGINSPETGRDGKPAEPLALNARDKLRLLLFQNGNQARMLPGNEARDRHGRLLANLWLNDGRNIGVHLLEQGLGWYVAIPPNVRFLACYRQAESAARQAEQGVWRNPAYAPQPSTGLKLRDTGFRLVEGKVVRVNRAAGATWINLEGRFAIRIPDHALSWFDPAPDKRWIGRRVEVRGWLYQRKGELRVNVGHPAAIRFLDPAT